MDGKRPRVTDIGDVVEQLQRVDEACAGLAARLELEADETTVTAPEIGVGATALLCILVQAGVDDARDLGMALQMERDLRRVAAVFAHPERQRLQPLDELEGIEGAHGRADVAQ